MEERDKLSAHRIDARQIRSLVGVTAVKGQRKIGRVIRPVVLLGDNVFDVMRKAGRFLAQPTVFTAAPGTLADTISRTGIHHEEPFNPR